VDRIRRRESAENDRDIIAFLAAPGATTPLCVNLHHVIMSARRWSHHAIVDWRFTIVLSAR